MRNSGKMSIPELSVLPLMVLSWLCGFHRTPPPLKFLRNSKNVIQRVKNKRKGKKRGTVIYNMYICLINYMHIIWINTIVLKKKHYLPAFFWSPNPHPFLSLPIFFWKKCLDPRLYMYILNTNVGKADYIIVNFPVNCIYM